LRAGVLSLRKKGARQEEVGGALIVASFLLAKLLDRFPRGRFGQGWMATLNGKLPERETNFRRSSFL